MFLEDDISCIGEIDRHLHLYEMMDLDIWSTLEQRIVDAWIEWE